MKTIYRWLGVIVICLLSLQGEAQDSNDLVPFLKNGYWGYCDQNRRIIIPTIFENAYPFSEGRAIAYKNGKAGFIDTKGKWAIQPKYKRAQYFHDGLAIALKEQKWVLIDRNGNELSKPYTYIDIKTAPGERQKLAQFFMVYDAGETSGFGFIDRSGKENVAPEYTRVRPYSNGLAAFAINDSTWGYLNTAGEVAIAPQFKDVTLFTHSMALVKTAPFKGKVINKKGEQIGDREYKYDIEKAPFVFNDNRCLIRSKGRWGYIDTLGNVAVDFLFSKAQPFSEGLALVRSKGKFGFINPNGEETIPFSLYIAGSFSEGFAPFAKDVDGLKLMGYIDKTGKEVIPAQFKFSKAMFDKNEYDFKNGRAIIKYDTGRGAIDKSGKEIISPQYYSLKPLVQGLAIVRKNNKCGVYDSNGELTCPIEYQKIYWPDNGLPLIKQEGLFGLIGSNGKIILAPKYDSIVWAGNNLYRVTQNSKGHIFYIDGKGTEFKP